ncbi:MAG: hypothetical protein EOO46_01380 [Flavobacterium sp.]|nr:MAG: hypothetical protein EOO46_01380 [Flavobacterium sp.]
MLIINKEYQNHSIVVTVSDMNTAINPLYRMDIESDFTNKEYSVQLSANTSPFPSRYDEFIIQNEAVEDFETGVYKYSIVETTSGSICEVGMLKIVDNLKSFQQEMEATSVVYKPSDSSADDFIVYKK